MKYMERSAALDRIGWLLDGLDGDAGWGRDAADQFAPQFAELVPTAMFLERTRRRALTYAPLRVVGIETSERTARARIRNHDGGGIDVVTCIVEPEPPHRITDTWVSALVPSDLAPRLPMDFTGHDSPHRTERARLTLFCGLPGVGKSTLADAVGRASGVPVFAFDWLMGALTPFGGRHFDAQWELGGELLTTLAYRQLLLGQSAILDHPAERNAERSRWHSLALRAGADFKVVLCICPDPIEHRARLEGRRRGIPGWHDVGNWADVQARTSAYPPWPHEILTIDTTRPHADNLATVLDYLDT